MKTTFVLLCLALSCHQASAQSDAMEAEKQALRALGASYEKAINSGDLRPLAGLLTAVPLASAVAAHAADLQGVFAPAAAARQCDVAAAANHIRHSGIARPRVWASYDHLVLWYLGTPQLSRAGVHPDNLARRAIIDTLARHGYVQGDELGRIMRELPDFVVTDADGRGLAWLREDGRPADTWLAANYRLDARYGKVLIYRKTLPAAPPK